MMKDDRIKDLILVVKEMEVKDLPTILAAIRSIIEPSSQPHARYVLQPWVTCTPATVEQCLQFTMNGWSENMQAEACLFYKHMSTKYCVPISTLYKFITSHKYKGSGKQESWLQNSYPSDFFKCLWTTLSPLQSCMMSNTFSEYTNSLKGNNS